MSGERMQVEITAVDRAGAVFKGLGREADALTGSLSGLLTPARLLSGAIGVGLVGALSSAVQSTVAFATQVRELSYLSGGSARDVSVLLSGLEDLGVEAQSVQQGMVYMSRAIDAGSPTLERLGVRTRGATGELKTGLELFYDTVDALGKVQNSTERASVAQELFGRGWMGMIEAVRLGSDEIRKVGEGNAALGKVMGEDLVAQAKALELAWNDLTTVADGLKIQLGAELIPQLTALAELLAGPAATAARLAAGAFQELQSAILLVAAAELQAATPFAWLTDKVGVTTGALQGMREASQFAFTAAQTLADKGWANLTLAERQLTAAIDQATDATRRNTAATAETAVERERRLKLLEAEVKAWVAVAEEEIRLAELEARYTLQQQADVQRAVETMARETIAAYVAMADAAIEESERAAQVELQTIEALFQARDRATASQLQAAEQVGRVRQRELDTLRTLRDALAEMEAVGLSAEAKIRQRLATIGDWFTGDFGAAMLLPPEERVHALTGLYQQLARYGEQLAQLMQPTKAGGWGDFSPAAWPETAAEKYRTLYDTVKATMAEVARAVGEAFDVQRAAATDAWQAATDSVAVYRREIGALGGDLDAITAKMQAMQQASALPLPRDAAAAGDSLTRFSDQALQQMAEILTSGGSVLMGRGGTDWGASDWGASDWPSYDGGGVIPGPVGRPYPIIAHGGETVVPAGAPAGSVTVNFSPVININGSQEDPGVLARRVRYELRDLFTRMKRDGQIPGFA